MATFFSFANVSDPVRHALEVVANSITEQLTFLSTKQQDEFWTEIHGYALTQKREKERPPLIASPHIEESVRRALEVIDGHICSQVETLSAREQGRFWEVLHESAEHILDESRASARYLNR